MFVHSLCLGYAIVCIVGLIVGIVAVPSWVWRFTPHLYTMTVFFPGSSLQQSCPAFEFIFLWSRGRRRVRIFDHYHLPMSSRKGLRMFKLVDAQAVAAVFPSAGHCHCDYFDNLLFCIPVYNPSPAKTSIGV